MRTRVKICGITNLPDAETAIAAGADALGFIFVPQTQRYITPNRASEIIRALPPFITTVGVFRNDEHKAIEDIATETGITSVQLHGTESPEFCQQLSLPVVKVFELQTKEDLQPLEDYSVSAYLVDKPKSISGETINLELALKARHHTNRLILAGGLTPENVADAIQYVKPYAVDVASGVESEKRRKDPQKIMAFIRAVRQAVEVETEHANNNPDL